MIVKDIKINIDKETRIKLYTGHWKYGRKMTMVDFVSGRTVNYDYMKMGRFPYMTSKNLAVGRIYLMLLYYVVSIAYSQQVFGCIKLIWNLSKLYSRHIQFD